MMKTSAPSSPSPSTTKSFLSLMIVSGTSLALTMAVQYLVMKSRDPFKDEKSAGKAAEKRLNQILNNKNGSGRRRRRNNKKAAATQAEKLLEQQEARQKIVLNSYERQIAGDVIDPNEITIRFRDVGGIDNIKTELWDLVVLPLRRPDLFQSESGLVSPPRGILLYGAPGTGKTMLAKAIARESHATFINVRLSTILNQYLGESNKLVAATFSLAQKLAPSVVFIDEIDTFLRQRGGENGNEASMGSIKTEFLTLWDGMLTENKNWKPVLVLGATNRPYDVDAAIQRRLPRTFEIGLPPSESRYAILSIILKKQPMTEQTREFIRDHLAKDEYTAGYSGSDLKELCKAAAMGPIREVMRISTTKEVTTLRNGSKRRVVGPPPGTKIRMVNISDFQDALKRVKKTGETAHTFRKKEMTQNQTNRNKANVSNAELAKGMLALQKLMMNNTAPSSS